MKRSSLSQSFIGAVLAFTFSFSAVGQLITGLELPCSVRSLVPLCIVFSVICSALFSFKYGWCGVLAITVGGAFWLKKSTDIVNQAISLANTLTTGYGGVYGTPIIGTKKTDESDAVLISVAFLVAAAVSFAICRRRRLWHAMCAALLPFAVLMPVKLTVPDTVYMYISMAGIAALLITNRVRRCDARHFASLFFRSCAASVVALALLIGLYPQDEYVHRMTKIRERLEDVFGGGSSIGSVIGGSSAGSATAVSIDLRVLGPKSDADYEVMTVEADFSGRLYMRGRDYDLYNGTSWISTEGRVEKAYKGRGLLGTITVTTKRREKVLYVPYYPNDAISFKNGYAVNENKEKEYSFTVYEHTVGYPYTYATSYTELPAETLAWANELLTEIVPPNMRTEYKIAAIRELVKSSARYDTKTTAMMNNSTDFAKWFIFESETGYCAHYATAATVLLRAAGIPARYVEGYVVDCADETEATVSNRRAHAWAEYFDTQSNTWHILEATPAEGLDWSEIAEDTPQTEAPVTDKTPTTEEAPVTDAPATEAPTTDTPATDDVGDVGGNDDPNAATPFTVPRWIKTVLLCLLVFSVIPIQAGIRISVKDRLWDEEKPNSAALARYKQCKNAARRTRTPLPYALEEIALKAKFSQHTVTDAELLLFDKFRKEIMKAVNKMPWYKKLAMRWVFAIG